MDIGKNAGEASGSLQISTEVVEKIARLAAMEVPEVVSISGNAPQGKNLLGLIAAPQPILVQINSDVADITVSLVLRYGAKVPEVSEKVQKNIKSSVQNMTNISVAKVNVVVTGIAKTDAEPQLSPAQ